MPNNRFFAVRRSIIKRDTNTVVLNGVRIAITDRNRERLNNMRQHDAEAAYEAAMFGRQHQSRFANA